MKKTTTLLLGSFGLLLLAFQWGADLKQEAFRPMNSGGAGPGKTGAPGEANCTACHNAIERPGVSNDCRASGTRQAHQTTGTRHYASGDSRKRAGRHWADWGNRKAEAFGEPETA